MFHGKYFFLTNRESNITHLCIPNTQLGDKHFTKYVYYPDKYETMTQNEIHTFQRRTVMRFMLWTLRNKDKFQDKAEMRTALSRFTDLNTNFMIAFAGSFVLSRFMKKWDLPFAQMFLEERGFSYSRLVNIFTLCVAAFGVYKSYRNIAGQSYMYDIALKYKDEFIPGVLNSSNCEDVVKRLQS